jgi:acetate kinase
MKILVFNAGSSSLKSHLYEIHDASEEEPGDALWHLEIDWSRRDSTSLTVKTAGDESCKALSRDQLPAEFPSCLETLWSGKTPVLKGKSEIDAVGHRIVHGGNTFRQSVRITPDVAADIDRLSEFAPAHNPIEADFIEAAGTLLGPAVPQVAVFDTAFHRTLPPAAYVYGGPYEWVEKEIRRYGFHGISHQYVTRSAARLLKKDLHSLSLVSCHLGGGCSLAAISGGRSVDTTMGFTPLDGLVMGTRSGSVDPGILLHLLRKEGYDAERLDRLLNRQSGLKGLSGISGDMRLIRKAMAEGSERARLAFDVFVHRLRSQIGAMAGALGQLDALIFTAGIGENSPEVRAAVCEGLGLFGIKIDAGRNAGSPRDADIAAGDSLVRVLVIRTEEDWEIARECRRLLQDN